MIVDHDQRMDGLMEAESGEMILDTRPTSHIQDSKSHIGHHCFVSAQTPGQLQPAASRKTKGAMLYRVPINYRWKVNGSERHKNGANQILFLCMFSPLWDIWFNGLQLILSSKLSELEQFENFSANNQLESKQE